MLLTISKKEGTLNFYRSAGFRDDVKTGFMMKLRYASGLYGIARHYYWNNYMESQRLLIDFIIKICNNRNSY
jgi:hypothetical protein